MKIIHCLCNNSFNIQGTFCFVPNIPQDFSDTNQTSVTVSIRTHIIILSYNCFSIVSIRKKQSSSIEILQSHTQYVGETHSYVTSYTSFHLLFTWEDLGSSIHSICNMYPQLLCSARLVNTPEQEVGLGFFLWCHVQRQVGAPSQALSLLVLGQGSGSDPLPIACNRSSQP